MSKQPSTSLRWVILLLVTVVVLPTVCLLWFMTQTIRNERLAVRSKLEEVYRRQCEAAVSDDHIHINLTLPMVSGILVYNENKKLTFPVPAEAAFKNTAVFKAASILEYQDNAYDQALEAYRQISETGDDPVISIRADMAQVRCLSRLNRTDEAVELLKKMIAEYGDDSLELRSRKCRAYLRLLELTPPENTEQLTGTLDDLYAYTTQGMANDDEMQYIGEAEFLTTAIPSGLQAFALSRYVEIAGPLPHDAIQNGQIKRAEKLVGLLNRSLDTARYYPAPTFVKSEGVTSTALFSLDTPESLYGRYHRFREHIRLTVFPRDFLISTLKSYIADLEQLPSPCDFKIYDDRDQQVAGADRIEGIEPFLKVPISEWLGGWTTHIYVPGLTFENAADEQAAVYLWSALLVIGLILLCGGAAAHALVRQQQMNRLKNNFIATVTHELKTPLASMRLLTDTLLEGRYNDSQTLDEYLRLIAGENKRLSHLIDNFLTFSRMERNKQVFDFQPVVPSVITTGAAEAMQAKLNGDHCTFTCNVFENLPTIRADRDAMVTVLVNLLDNAYKYSGEQKQIELRANEENGHIIFSVKDNGVGISPRAQRKIFDRFYQADTSLSRRAEGCGLGLSIVRFIVDAHKGTIRVESRPGKGSTFTIRLPVYPIGDG